MVVAVPPPPVLIRVLRRFTLCLLRRHDWAWGDNGKSCFCCSTPMVTHYGEVLSGDFYRRERVEAIEDRREQAVRESMHDILERRRARRNREAFFSRS